MPARSRAFAFLRSTSAFLAIALLLTSGMLLAQDSFMLHYTASAIDGGIINRGDFNNDGIPDIVVGNNGGTNSYGVSVLLGVGDGTFQSPRNAAFGEGAFDMTVGDFNGDGKLDVALAGYNSPTQNIIQILLGNGDGTFTNGQTINLPANQGITGIATGDFNNDGKLDLAYVTTTTNNIYFYKGAGNGTFTSAGSKAVGNNTSMVQIRTGDFNRDGKVDLMVSDYGSLYVLWNTGNFTFNPVTVASASAGVFGTPVDVNQDSYTDLIASEQNCSGQNCTTSFTVLLGSASKNFTASATVDLGPTYAGFSGTTAADINGDGINDIVGLSHKELLIFLGNPDGSYQNTPLVFPNAGLGGLVASDFNRDGKVDFAAVGSGGSPTLDVGVYLNATPRAACTPGTLSPSVTVCQPQDLTYLNSPVDWIADSRDTSHPVTDMQIYVDNKLVVNSPSSSLNEPLTLSNGPHYVVTKAWDESGANFRSDRDITIYTGTPGETCAASPSSMNVCSPTQNEITTTSVHIFANADSQAAQITAVQVYIDGSLKYNDTSGATYVDTSMTVTTGSHSIVVKAWDANGHNYSESRNITAQ